jgi:hypothetical protein
MLENGFFDFALTFWCPNCLFFFSKKKKIKIVCPIKNKNNNQGGLDTWVAWGSRTKAFFWRPRLVGPTRLTWLGLFSSCFLFFIGLFLLIWSFTIGSLLIFFLFFFQFHPLTFCLFLIRQHNFFGLIFVGLSRS